MVEEIRSDARYILFESYPHRYDPGMFISTVRSQKHGGLPLWCLSSRNCREARRHALDQERVRGKPFAVGVRIFVTALEWIAAQIEYFRDSQLHERLRLVRHLLCALRHEHSFPIVVS